MTTLLPPPLQNVAAAGGPHADAKSVRLGTTPVVGLKGAFQSRGSLVRMSRCA